MASRSPLAGCLSCTKSAGEPNLDPQSRGVLRCELLYLWSFQASVARGNVNARVGAARRVVGSATDATAQQGELRKGTIDRQWPHQVALRADFVAGRKFPPSMNSAGRSRCAARPLLLSRRDRLQRLLFCRPRTPSTSASEF